MPQLFQVLRCYKCSIFQVHQTKKDNKWKCKVCGEKQSVKRHYGIGTAKDCRLHVQKLNNIQGNQEETKLNITDSDSVSDTDENDTKIGNNINNTSLSTNNARKESKWSDFVEKEEICAVKEPEYIDNVEVCLELPQKRKSNRKNKTFKVPKLSSDIKDCDNKTEIINDISKLSNRYDKLDGFNCNFKDVQTDVKKTSMKNTLVSYKKHSEVMKLKVNKTSKWDQYDSENIDSNTFAEKSFNSIEDNLTHQEDYGTQSVDYSSQKDDSSEYNNDKHIINELKRSQNKERDIHHASIKPIFSLCDDNELDNILDF